MNTDLTFGVLAAFGSLVLLFVILREFWTWYWKQSEQVALLKHIAASLQRLEEQGRPLPPGSPAALRQPAPAPTP